ncbi:hypothetical protein DFQ09_105129 [Winogradskyella pacifica]|uniref:Uncharacterized protein n=1 Tax=Winogradskyella pacifica TaxID=664642 RepID=A0A3D9MD22_9FLAO|nr:hypothetical protein [Winogradskyella pacifica]REE16917.1 hypothetical protein DFQ09_105129 [Winogradskyella pacifica]
MSKKKNKIKKNKDLYRESVLQHYTESYKSETYARQRIDIITIALSTGGIVLGLSILKYIFDKNMDIDPIILKVSIFLFMLTIIINYVNQHIAVKAHNNEKKWAKKEDEITKYGLDEENNIKDYSVFNKAIRILNTSNFIMLIVSIFTMAYFFLFTF